MQISSRSSSEKLSSVHERKKILIPPSGSVLLCVLWSDPIFRGNRGTVFGRGFFLAGPCEERRDAVLYATLPRRDWLSAWRRRIGRLSIRAKCDTSRCVEIFERKTVERKGEKNKVKQRVWMKKRKEMTKVGVNVVFSLFFFFCCCWASPREINSSSFETLKLEKEYSFFLLWVIMFRSW